MVKRQKKIKEQQGESTIWRAYRAKHTEMMCRVNGPFCIFSRVELQQFQLKLIKVSVLFSLRGQLAEESAHSFELLITIKYLIHSKVSAHGGYIKGKVQTQKVRDKIKNTRESWIAEGMEISHKAEEPKVDHNFWIHYPHSPCFILNACSVMIKKPPSSTDFLGK